MTGLKTCIDITDLTMCHIQRHSHKMKAHGLQCPYAKKIHVPRHLSVCAVHSGYMKFSTFIICGIFARFPRFYYYIRCGLILQDYPYKNAVQFTFF